LLRRVTPRSTKNAQIARMGNMNNDTAAPLGMFPDRMPTWNA
jgi:hypothetical protein